jgi:hypothetical protein
LGSEIYSALAGLEYFSVNFVHRALPCVRILRSFRAKGIKQLVKIFYAK